jgi:hypothetical protein
VSPNRTTLSQSRGTNINNFKKSINETSGLKGSLVFDIGRESSPPPQVNVIQVKPEVGPRKIQIEMEDESNSSGTPKRKYSSGTSSNNDKIYNVEDESPH